MFKCDLNVVLGVGESCLAFRDLSPLTTRFQPPMVCVFYTQLWRMSRTNFWRIELFSFSLCDRL